MTQRTFQTVVVTCLICLVCIGAAVSYYVLIYQPEQQRIAAAKAAAAVEAAQREIEANFQRQHKAQWDAEFDRDPHAAIQKLIKEADAAMKDQ